MKDAEEYLYKGYWGNQVLGDIFDFTVRDYPDSLSLVQGEKRLTYGEFGKMVNRLSLKLLEMGIGKDDFVVIVLPNCPEYAFFHYAVVKVGAVNVPMVHTQKVREISYVVDLLKARTLVISSGIIKYDFIQMAKEIRDTRPFLENVIVVGESPPVSDMIPFQSLVSEPVTGEGNPETLRKPFCKTV